MGDPPFTVQQLAERWGCSKHDIYALIHAGKLAYFKVGEKLTRIPAKAVEGKTISDYGGLPNIYKPPRSSRLADKVRKEIAKIGPADEGDAGHVYFCKCGQYVKVGFSLGPLDRVGTIESYNPKPLELLGTIRGTLTTERAIHGLLKHFHHHHEWFHLKPTVRKMIKELCGG
jgi:excisionase family DNA binding protein